MPKINVPSTMVRDVKLDELDPETIAAIKPEDITLLRAEYLPRAAASIEDGPGIQIDGKSVGSCGSALREWAKRMAAKHGSDTIVTWRTPLPWVTALAVVIYGEAPIRLDGSRVWPDEWKPSDVSRALAWENGKIPAAVSGAGVIRPGANVTGTLS